ncbi:MAG: hypothetical protein Q4C73_02225 [Eubacteriales bacterium]|nr:hypothetical protein [Eubacteriales bacterium]
MKKWKYLIAVCVIMFTTLAGTIAAYAAESPANVQDYKTIMDQINDEYGVNLQFIAVDTERVSLQHYEDVVRQQAMAERAVQNSIRNNPGNYSDNGMQLLKIEYDRNGAVNLDYGTIMTCTYPVYDGKTVGRGKRAALNMSTQAINAGGALSNVSKPQYALASDSSWLRVEFGANVMVAYVPVGGRTFAAYFSATSSWPAN